MMIKIKVIFYLVLVQDTGSKTGIEKLFVLKT